MSQLRIIGYLCLFLIVIGSAMFILEYEELKEISSLPAQEEVVASGNSTRLFDKLNLTGLALLKPLKSPRPLEKFLLVPNVTQEVPKNLTKQEVKWSMIVAIKSDYRRYLQRQAIRDSWGGIRFLNGVRMNVVYVVALPDSLEDEAALKNESNTFGDLLQINKNETYRGVGFKAMAAMQWVGEHFPDNWLYFSADDDILPDFTSLHEKMQTLFDKAEKEGNIEENLPIYCSYRHHPAALVRRSGKWIVAQSEYPQKSYPPMCEGGFYGLTVKLTKAIYNASRHYPYFRHDDIFLTAFMRLAVCDSFVTEFNFDKSDPFCAISKMSNWNFKHINVKPKAYASLWNVKEKRMLADGAVILREPA